MNDDDLAKLAKLIAQNPGTLAYPHHAGSAPIVPTQEGQIKQRSLEAMTQQTASTMGILTDFVELAMKHARKLQDRVEISKMVHLAKIQFTPLIGHRYFLYEKQDHSLVLSMIHPEEWRGKCPFLKCSAQVEMLSDHTWDIIERYESSETP